jgi:hypothetical protein
MMASTPRPDFLRPQRGVSAWAWVALGVSLLVLADAGHDAWLAWQARQAAPIGEAPVAVAPPPKPDVELQRALKRAHAQLDRPWPAAFEGIEAIQRPGVRWLALNIGESGHLRLEGLAPDAAAAIAVADALRHQAIWRDAVPGRIENSAAGAGPVRFELSATLLGAEAP